MATVTVRTREEFDRAFPTADRIVVQGDDELRLYAENRALGILNTMIEDVTETHLADADVRYSLRPEVHGQVDHAEIAPPPLGPNAKADVNSPSPSDTSGWHGRSEISEAPSWAEESPTPSRRRLWISLAVIAFLTVAGAVAWWFWPRGPVMNHGSYDMSSTAPRTFDPSILIWPMTAIIGMTLIYMLARQAINANSNVEISWKVTSKVEGKLVITKVKERVRRSPK